MTNPATAASLPTAILIANRGEIAVRIARTCRSMGIRAIAVHSRIDRDAPHVAAADDAVELTGPSPAAGYLDGEQIIATAKATGATAIHPGYGFLSENAAFAAACRDAGLIFIGPSEAVIARLGDKIAGKAIAEAANVPTVPGVIDGEQRDAIDKDVRDRDLIAAAERLTFPLMVKASAGGGGRGMRIVTDAKDLPQAITTARREAHNAFGDDRLLIERLITSPRHIEVQVFGDHFGNVVHLHERDCSVQRRHQKIIEEAPAPNLKSATRASLHAAALSLARAVDYDNAGTVEFIVDGESEEYFFLEVNTRLQVEHPVTEFLFGVDLVEWQIRVAAGQPLPRSQDQLSPVGSAIEARVTAEDAARDFRPQTGTIAHVLTPMHSLIRYDSAIADGLEVTPYYDSLLAKVIAYGTDRASAIHRLDRALARTAIMGVTTNLPFLRCVLANADFVEAKHTTTLVSKIAFSLVSQDAGSGKGKPPPSACELAAAVLLARHGRTKPPSLEPVSPWTSLGAWRGGRDTHWPARTPVALADEDGHRHAFWLRIQDREALLTPIADAADGEAIGERHVAFAWSGDRLRVRSETEQAEFATHVEHQGGAPHRLHIAGDAGARWFIELDGRAAWRAQRHGTRSDETRVRAPGPGLVTAINAKVGDAVAVDAPLVVIESMKMLQTLTAPCAGTIAAVHCTPGQAIAGGDILIDLAPTHTGRDEQ